MKSLDERQVSRLELIQMQPGASSSSLPTPYHAVRFYENDKSLARIVAEFLLGGFDHGGPGLVVATAAQRAAIIRELTARSVDVVELQRSHDLLLLDAKGTLATFMIDGKPEPRKFKDQTCQVIAKLCRGRADCTVRIFGSMVDVLWQNDERDAAVRLEMLWNHLLCGYTMGQFYKDADFDDVSRQHSHIVSADGTSKAVA
jgi:hypothetical protein